MPKQGVQQAQTGSAPRRPEGMHMQRSSGRQFRFIGFSIRRLQVILIEMAPRKSYLPTSAPLWRKMS
jgi:hypothetical protein